MSIHRPTATGDRRCAGSFLVVLFGLLAATMTAGAAETTVPFRSGPVVVPDRPDAVVAASLSDLATRNGERHALVTLRRGLVAGERDALRAQGIDLQRAVGPRSYFAALDPALPAEALADAGLIADAAPIAQTWKLDPWLLEGRFPHWAAAPVDDPATPVADRVVAAYVVFHADVDLVPDAFALIALHGGRVRSALHSINGLVVEIPFGRIDGLAWADEVQWIEPALPKFVELNNSNRAITGAETAQSAPYDLDGSGVSVLVYDGGFGLESHQDFGGRLTVRDSSGLSDHSTHVAGTIGGSGAGSSGLYRGMAPGVTIESYGFEQEGGLTEGFLYTDPGDIEADYGEAINTYGVDISNNSIGTNTAPNGFPCEWEGNYGVTSTVIDSIVRGSLSGGVPFRIVWANGNERQGFASCGSTYHTTAPPACAKNHITVGALNSNDDSMTDFSSWGPTDDGRIKPDISAPGCQSDDDGTVTSCSSSGGYVGKCGTSMASPTVCGLSALILQDFRIQYPLRDDFRNSTLKTFLAHTAEDGGNTGPDYQYGYGSVRVVPAIDLMRSENWIEAEIDQGNVYSVLVIVNPGDPELKVTLAWDDPPGTPNVSPALVNDLDLEVFDAGNTQYFPWTLDPDNGGAPAVRTVADHANNIEQVVIDDPAPGVYRIDIRGFAVPQGPQSFSLAASPLLINCSSAGVVTLDRVKYACTSEAVVRVVDCDLNTDDGVVETVSVVVASDSEPGGETIILTETGAETAAFEAVLPIDTADAPGTLLVADGDTITATYVDADDGFGGTNVDVQTASLVDCQPPQVLAIGATDVGPFSAKVQILTDEPVQANVRYGTQCITLGTSAGSASFKTDHLISLLGLQDDTTYRFEADLVDQAGNTLTADNDGDCYLFTTPEIPDYFTEQFSGGVDLVGHTLMFTPNGGPDFYGGCIEEISALPTDPAGGTTVSLSDDDSEPVNLAGGDEVLLYGTAYGTVYVGSNGYLTFTGTDTDYSESISDHFDTPRVSALFDDLNPSAGGTVSWRQLADRLAVTWDGVPEYNTSNSNVFQIEMFFDGRIHISHLSIAAADGITGLSAGGGIPPEFFERDLSTLGGCGPIAPSADGQLLATPSGVELPITLTASDDGDPGPLSYVITSLPNQTLRDAGTGLPITAGELPYTLVANGSAVTYAPGGAFSGLDQFTFLADDGGMPPSGGPSAEAVIGILVGDPALQHSFPLDTDPGWTTAGSWAYGHPTGSGGFPNVYPNNGHTGPNCYSYNLSGNYANNLPATNLTTTAIDCSGLSGTQLRFWRWLGVQASESDQASVQVSNDGVNWEVVWAHSGGNLSEVSWSQHAYDISSVADGHSTVFLRWVMGPTDSSITFPGWNVDDIEIWGFTEPTAGTPGDVDGDGDVDVSDLVAVILAWGPCPGCPEDFNGDGVVDVADLVQLILNWSGPAPATTGSGTTLAHADDGAADDALAADADAANDDRDDVDALVNDGRLAPIESGGVVTVERPYRQTATGVLAIEIAGPLPVDDHDLLVVRGRARLDGTLEVAFADGYVPAPGDRFAVLVADDVDGRWAVLEVLDLDDALDARVEYGARIVEVAIAARDGDVPARAVRRAVSADLDGDGAVTVGDLETLIHAWGDGASPADLDENGRVDGADLRLLLEGLLQAFGG